MKSDPGMTFFVMVKCTTFNNNNHFKSPECALLKAKYLLILLFEVQ